MNGTQLTVYAPDAGRQKHGKRLVDWILDEARNAGLHGATVQAVSEYIDAHGKYHAARFVELAEQPVSITVAGDTARIDSLMERLRESTVPLFYTHNAIEYEALGSDA